MSPSNTPFSYSRYLFVFAHPDDEIYTCAFIAELILKWKVVDVLYVTSGDYNGPEIAVERKKEVSRALWFIGIKEENVHFLWVSERQLMDQALETREALFEQALKINPDCIVGHDFEGGHNAHDLSSYFTSYIAQKIWAAQFVFPAYHNWPGNRIWNEFVTSKSTDYEFVLSESQREFQRNVVWAHKTQEGFMNLLLNNGHLFPVREVLRYISTSIDYTVPPASPVWYEYPGSKITFAKLRDVILSMDYKPPAKEGAPEPSMSEFNDLVHELRV